MSDPNDSGYAQEPYDIEKMPPGIPFIIGNEAAERFSFYGMKAILVVFMTKYLHDSSGNLDVMSPEDSKSWMHLFVASAYFFPLIGALVSDWLFGKYKTILGLSIVYCAGHAALAIWETRQGLILGLTLIAIGAGGIKPCVSAHVGDQFGARNKHLLSKVFSWFYFSINLGAFVSTLLTPILLDRFGPGVAFGVPGLLMLIATIVFWMGRHRFVHIPPGGAQFVKESMSREGWTAIARLLPLFLFVAMFWCLFDQTASAWVLQAERMDRQWLGFEWLSSQIQAVNPIMILILIPVFTFGIYPLINAYYPLTPLRKVGIGFFITVLSFSISAIIEEKIAGGDVLSVSSTFDPERTGGSKLIDGAENGSGWMSKFLPGSEEGAPAFPQTLVLQTRERRAYPLESIEFNPYTTREMTVFKVDPKHPVSSDFESNWARKIKVYAGAARDPKDSSWALVGEIELEQTLGFQRLDLENVASEYLKIEIHSNYGGNHVSLGEIRINAAGEMPADSHSTAAAVWPNVAAAGFKPTIAWQIFAYVILTAAEVMVSITCLEFAYTQSPSKMKSIVMSFFLLSVTIGNLYTVAVNLIIANPDGTSKLAGASYYWFFSGAMLITALLYLLYARTYRGREYMPGVETTSEGPAI